MRLARLLFATLLLGCALMSAQQAPAPTQPADSSAGASTTKPATVAQTAATADVPSVPSSVPTLDSNSRVDAKAAERARKEQAKADAKAQKEAEKQKKQEEADSKLLKLEDNEIAISVFDDNGNPVKLPPCGHKDKDCQEKRKEILKQKRVPLTVQNGTLSIDGLIARARLNYDIPSYLYLYISIPGYGTIITSPVHFPYSTEAKDALDGSMLSFKTSDDHFIELASEKSLSGHGKRSIFYAVDHGYQQPGRYPTIGYGTLSKAPYVWPGAIPMTEEQKRRIAVGPELPKGLAADAAVAAVVPCQAVAPGGTIKPVKVNNQVMLPKPCKPGETASTAAPISLPSQAPRPAAQPAEAPAPASKVSTTTATPQDPSR